MFWLAWGGLLINTQINICIKSVARLSKITFLSENQQPGLAEVAKGLGVSRAPFRELTTSFGAASSRGVAATTSAWEQRGHPIAGRLPSRLKAEGVAESSGAAPAEAARGPAPLPHRRRAGGFPPRRESRRAAPQSRPAAPPARSSAGSSPPARQGESGVREVSAPTWAGGRRSGGVRGQRQLCWSGEQRQAPLRSGDPCLLEGGSRLRRARQPRRHAGGSPRGFRRRAGPRRVAAVRSGGASRSHWEGPHGVLPSRECHGQVMNVQSVPTRSALDEIWMLECLVPAKYSGCYRTGTQFVLLRTIPALHCSHLELVWLLLECSPSASASDILKLVFPLWFPLPFVNDVKPMFCRLSPVLKNTRFKSDPCSVTPLLCCCTPVV